MDRKIIKQTLNLMEHKVIYITCMLISCGAYAVYQILTSFVHMFLINSIIGKNMNQLIISFVLLVLALIISIVIDPIVTYKFNQCINSTTLKIRIKVFTKIVSFDNSFMSKYTSGDLITRITNDILSVERLFGREAYILLTSIIYGTGASISMFSLNWHFAIFVFIMSITLVIASFYSAPQLHKVSNKVQKKHTVLNQTVIDSVLGSKSIKVFCMHDYYEKKYTILNRELIDCEMKKNKINSRINAINFLFSSINIIGAFSIGALMVIRGSLDFGTIIAVIGLQKGVIFMFERVGRYYTMMQTSLVSASRLLDILNQRTYYINQKINIVTDKFDINENAIVFNDVKFGYFDKKDIIENLSLRIKKNEVILITGTSGAGKSTLIKLILGLYELKEGEILVNNHKVNKENKIKIRESISYVPQDAFLFNATIEQNITCNQIVESSKAVIDAAKKANIHSFIMSLPCGYDTIIQENASNLSSGQKQRIAIARAFFKNAPIILMDEPTASLDAKSEKEIKQSLEKLCYGKAVIIVSHKDNILKKITRKYVLRGKTLVEYSKPTLD